MLPFLLLILLRCLLLRRTVPFCFPLPTRLPLGRRHLLAVAINVYVKLTEFQSGLAQVLVKLILSSEQKLTEIASISSELRMNHLVRHRDANAEGA